MKKYCFLNCIYSSQSDDLLYEITISSPDFSDVTIERVHLDQLQKMMNDYVTDFSIEDGYLKCSPVPTLPASGNVLQRKVKKPETPYTLFNLLDTGVRSGFYFVPDDVVELDEYKGEGIVSFGKTRFSQSSMSVYFRLIRDGKIGNVYLIDSNRNTVEFQPFYFAVPIDWKGTLHASFIKTMKINNMVCKIFRLEEALICEPVLSISYPMINKAVCSRTKWVSVLNVLKAFRQLFYEKPAPLEWENRQAIGNKVNTITFISSYSEIKPKDADSFLVEYKRLAEGLSYEEAQKRIINSQYNVVAKLVYLYLTEITNSGDVIEMLKKCNDAISSLERTIFFTDMYLYKIRSYACLAKNSIVWPVSHQLIGSNETGFTIVNEEVL